MNVDIFEKLASSSLVFVDITGLRPNCLFEYGFAIARNKKVVCVARDDTKLPWDVETLPCNFWSAGEENSNRREKLEKFMKLNIDRESLIPE
jgi:nucleoside 2-deoxyribosyltransferase